MQAGERQQRRFTVRPASRIDHSMSVRTQCVASVCTKLLAGMGQERDVKNTAKAMEVSLELIIER
jgi:hypothetical protein